MQFTRFASKYFIHIYHFFQESGIFSQREYEELKKQMMMEVAEKKRRLQSQLTASVPTTGIVSSVTNTAQHSAPATVAVASTLMVAPASRSLRSTGPSSTYPTAIADTAGPPANKRRSEVPSSSSAGVLSLLNPTALTTAGFNNTSSSSTSSALGAAPANLQHSLPEESMRYRFTALLPLASCDF